MLHFQCTSHKLKITFTFHLFFLRNLVLTLFDINIKVLSFILLKNVGKRNYKLVKLKSYKEMGRRSARWHKVTLTLDHNSQ